MKFVCLLGLSLLTTATSWGAVAIREGDTWRYYKGSSHPPAGWNTVGFNDSSWGGPAASGFGYGDCDDATVFSDMQNNYRSVFIRRQFHVADPAAILHLTLAADYDDGFVAYLNGVEVARRNLPAGTPTNTTLAVTDHEASRGQGASTPNEKEFIALDPALLVTGSNVLAVSGHNVSAGSSDFSLIIELYTNVTLVRGPFLQLPRTNAVTVVWRTDALTDSAVDFGFTPACELGTVSDSTLVREHVIHVNGLLPGTNYHYRVRSAGVTLSGPHVFRTPPVAGDSYRWVIIGDHGQGTTGMTNIANRVNARADFDFLITVGDNIYGQLPCNLDGAPGWYDPFFFWLYGATMARAPIFVTLGNHDTDTANGQWSVDYFHMPTNGPPTEIEKNFSYDYGDAHLLVVDTEPFADNETARMEAIRTWVSNDLAATTQPWKFVFLHRPPYTSVGGHDDQANVKAQLAPLFAHFGVNIVFQGHNHWYERINAINAVHYITSGASGSGLYTPNPRKSYSAVLRNDVFSYTHVEITGTRLKLRQFDAANNQIDEFNLDRGHAFQMDGLLDNAAWLRADNGLKLYAAIRQYYLYVATQDAGEGSDHFIYVHNQTSTNRPANWAKAGTVMQWNCFLADENDGGFHGWFGATEAPRTNFPAYASMTSGLNNNGAAGNGVLEGTVNLLERFGVFPTHLLLQAAAYQTADGGSRVVDVPAGQFLNISTRQLALDLPVAHAGTNQSCEAGMTVILDATGSVAPSGLPLAYRWSQLAGVPVHLVNSNTPVAGFAATTNINDVLTFQLTVHDTRFDSNATVTVTLTQVVDIDGDGLSDAEETSGWDNILTAPNPAGYVTDPTRWDTDGDGQSDGAEALAGTDPNDPNSTLKVTRTDRDGGGFRIEWTAVPGKTYVVEYRDVLTNSWNTLTNIHATTSLTNHLDTAAAGLPQRFYRVRLGP